MIPPRTYQETRQPDPGKLWRMKGMSGPSKSRAMLDPLTKIPVAIPLRLLANQAEARAMMGTLEAALPAPVSVRMATANSKESEIPVRKRLTATKIRATEITRRGPIRVAKYPPTREKTRYPMKFPVPIHPIWV